MIKIDTVTYTGDFEAISLATGDRWDFPGSRPLPRLSTSLSSPSVKALLLSATEEYDSGDFGHGSLRGSDSSDVTWPLNMDSSASLRFEGGIAAQVCSASALIFSATDVFRQTFPKE